MKKERIQKFEIYNHRVLWATAQKNLLQSRESENDVLYFALSAMLMMYFSFEGYLNWLGHLIAPDVWISEKEFFNKAPYQGTLGKYLFLSKILVLEPPEKSKGPFQTLKELQQLRDKSVHPRTERGNKNVKYTEGKATPNHRSWLSTSVTKQKRDTAEKHIQKMVKTLHKAALVHYPEVVDTSEPFTELIGFNITDY